MLQLLCDQHWKIGPDVSPKEPLGGAAAAVLGLVLIDGKDCSPQVPLGEVGDLQQHVLDRPHCPLRRCIAPGPIIRTIVVFNMISMEKLYEVVAESRPVVGDNNPGAVKGRHVALEHLDCCLRGLVGGHPCPVPASPLALQDLEARPV